MYRHPRQYVENRREVLIYQIESLVDKFNELTAELEELPFTEDQWKHIGELSTKTFLSIDEIKDEIYSL